MKSGARKRVVSELRKHGATHEQALGYVLLAEQFERESTSFEIHHLLPKGCGWWNNFYNLRLHKWNCAKVSLGGHAALHGYLYHVFPKNKSLHEAIRAVFIRRRLAYKKSIQNKHKIIKMYESGRSVTWICKHGRLLENPHPCTVYGWLKSWGIKFRSNGESNASLKKEKFKSRIIAWYAEGRTATWITKKIGLKGSANSVLSWLKVWGYHKNQSESRIQSYRFKHRTKLKKVVKLYKRELSIDRIACILKIDPKTVRNILILNGIKLRSMGVYVRSPKRKQFKSRILQWHESGISSHEIAKKVGISSGKVIKKWLKDWSSKILK